MPISALTGHTVTADDKAPEATRYYSQMTEAQKAEIRHEALVSIVDDARLALRVALSANR